MWDGYDSVYNHAILAGRGSSPPNDAGNGPALLSYQKGVYTPRKVFYETAQLFKFVRPGAVRIAVSESTAATMFAFHNQATGAVTIVGWQTGSAINFSGTLSNLPPVPPFEFYVTTGSLNMQRGTDIAVNNNAFSFTAPAGSIFTLTYAGSSGAAAAPAGSAVPGNTETGR